MQNCIHISSCLNWDQPEVNISFLLLCRQLWLELSCLFMSTLFFLSTYIPSYLINVLFIIFFGIHLKISIHSILCSFLLFFCTLCAICIYLSMLFVYSMCKKQHKQNPISKFHLLKLPESSFQCLRPYLLKNREEERKKIIHRNMILSQYLLCVW
jgi:hypothetical protein